jgi:hypothetical protein
VGNADESYSWPVSWRRSIAQSVIEKFGAR